MSTAELRIHPSLPSQFLPSRDVLVALPPDYAVDTARRYPVLYLQDGQNLFGEATSPVSGRGWHLDTTATTLVANGTITSLLLVGIPNNPDQRAAEYTMTHNAERQILGKGELYGRMLVEEIKPFIDREYRTLPEARHTGLGGSSFGALIALHVGLSHPYVFGNLALLSLALGWDGQALLHRIETLSKKPPLRIWLDMGTQEGERMLTGVRTLRDALVAKGWALGADLKYFEADGAVHDEAAWAERVPLFLPYLFPNSDRTED